MWISPRRRIDPGILEGFHIALRGLELADGLHPNRAGVERIVAGLLPQAEMFVRSLAAQ